MNTCETLNNINALIDRGYDVKQIVENLRDTLPPINVEEMDKTAFTVDTGYNIPPQIVISAYDLGFPIQHLELAKAEFDMYWRERGENPVFPHSLFLKHLDYLLRNARDA